MIGYMRVSTDEQDMDLQYQALVKAGVDPRDIFSDKMSGRSMKRPGLTSAIKACLPNSILVVWKLDRLGRTMRGMLDIMELLEKKKVQLVSLTQSLDTGTPEGRMMINMLISFGQMESEMIAARTKAGLDAKKKRDKHWSSGPRHGVLSHPKRREIFTELWESGLLKTLPTVEILRRINEPDLYVKGKKVKDFSPQSWNQWEKKGFRPFIPPEFDDPELEDD